MSDSRRRWRCSNCASWFRTVIEIEIPKWTLENPAPPEHHVYCLPCLQEVGGFVIMRFPDPGSASVRVHSSNPSEVIRISDTSVTPPGVVETAERGDCEGQDPGSGYVLRWPHD